VAAHALSLPEEFEFALERKWRKPAAARHTGKKTPEKNRAAAGEG
jgi:hypothetical protein